MDWSLAAVGICMVVAMGLTLVAVMFGRDLRADAANEAERRHVAECALLDATIASLRGELAADREAGTDGAAAAGGLVGEALRIAGAPDDRELWRIPADHPAGAGGDAPAPPTAPA